MDEPLSPPSSLERWVSWGAFVVAIILGWVMLWALGGPIGSEGPAHAMTPVPCERWDLLPFLLGIGLTGVAGVKLIARAMKRGGWWQVGLWAGFVLIADALLMVQYVWLVPTPPCLD